MIRFFGICTWMMLAATPSFAATKACEMGLVLADFSLQTGLLLEQNEMVATPVLPLPSGRFAFGTAVTERPEGGTVLGGRLVVQAWEGNQPQYSLELPGANGKPFMVSVLRASLDGTTLVATGGYLGGGPLVGFDSSPIRHRYSVMEMRDRIGNLVDRVVEVIGEIENGRASGQLLWGLGVDPNITIPAYRSNPKEFPSALRQAFAEMYPNERPEPVPPYEVQIHPSGQELVTSAGDFATIRDAKTGREKRVISLHAARAPEVLDPPKVFYAGRGKFLLGFSRKYLTLWDAETGAYLDAMSHPAEVDEDDGPFVSPAADRFTILFRSQKAVTRCLYGVDETKRKLVKEREFSVSAGTNAVKTPPLLAFSAKGTYATVMPNGMVEFVNKNHATLQNFSLPETIRATLLDLSHNGASLALAVRVQDRACVEIRETHQMRGVQLCFPDPDLNISDIRFTPEGGNVMVTTWRRSGKAHELHFIDVYRSLASLGSPAK